MISSACPWKHSICLTWKTYGVIQFCNCIYPRLHFWYIGGVVVFWLVLLNNNVKLFLVLVIVVLTCRLSTLVLFSCKKSILYLEGWSFVGAPRKPHTQFWHVRFCINMRRAVNRWHTGRCLKITTVYLMIIVGIVACVEEPAIRENYSPDKEMEGMRYFRTHFLYWIDFRRVKSWSSRIY